VQLKLSSSRAEVDHVELRDHTNMVDGRELGRSRLGFVVDNSVSWGERVGSDHEESDDK
jgi:hypothetical protein